uniref:Uncharacterized protein n=1 Tax=viral metagenome TaxID=1070528 RepID=A0A6M3LFB8_9ZZZZ
MKALRVRKTIREAEPLPRWYGGAWWNVDTRTVVCYPWPLNLVLALCRTWWLRVRWRAIRDPLEEAYAIGYRKGQHDAHKEWFVEEVRKGAL